MNPESDDQGQESVTVQLTTPTVVHSNKAI